jgi:arginine decarboxylase-like protein
MNKEDLMVCAQQCLKDKECCNAKSCKFHIDYEEEFNCSMISIYENGALSLREIAKREGLSFARIKQIQDKALVKLKKRLPDGIEMLASSGKSDYLF